MTPPNSSRPLSADWPPVEAAKPARRMVGADRVSPGFRPRPEVVADVDETPRLILSPDDRIGISREPVAQLAEARPASVWRSIGVAFVGVLAIVGAVTLLRLVGTLLVH